MFLFHNNNSEAELIMTFPEFFTFSIWFLIIIAGMVPPALFLTIKTVNSGEKFSLTEFLIYFLSFWCILQVSAGILLGLSGIYRLFWLVIVESACLTGGTLLLVFSGLLKTFHLPRPDLVGLSFIEKLVILGFFVEAGMLLLKAVMQPVTNVDSMGYHLPVIIRWYQNGSILQIPDVGFGTYYPYNWEVLSLSFVLPFHGDIFSALPGFLSWVITGLAVYAICRKLQILRVYAMSSTLLVLSIPLLIYAVPTIHVDLPLAAFFMIGLFCILSLYQSYSLSQINILFPVLGMIAGIKTTGIPLSLILLALLIIALILKESKKEEGKVRKISIPFLTALILLTVLLGGFWYARNWIVSGNPFGFLKIQILGREIFHGAESSSDIYRTTLAYSFHWFSLEDWKILLSQIVLRLQFPVIALSVLALFSFKGLFKRGGNRFYTGFLLLLLAALSYLYFNTPFTSDIVWEKKMTPWIGFAFRYGFMNMAVLGILAGFGMKLFRLPGSLCAVIALSGFLDGTAGMILFDNVKEIFGFDRAVLLMMFKRRDPEIIRITDEYLKILIPYGILFIAILFIWAGIFLDSLRNKLKILLKTEHFTGSFVKWGISILAIYALTFSVLQIRSRLNEIVYGETASKIWDNYKHAGRIGSIYIGLPYILYGRDLLNDVIPLQIDTKNLGEFTNRVESLKLDLIAAGPSENDPLGAVGWLEDVKCPFERILGEDPRKLSNLEKMKYNDYRIKALYRRKVP
jgi:uncharacterized membrane protein